MRRMARGLLLLASGWLHPVPAGAEQATLGPSVEIEFMVEDARGHAVKGLGVVDVEVRQGDLPQKIATFRERPEPGQYELSYAPSSGQTGAVFLRVLRPGTRVRGLDGPAIKPRVVAALSPLERELAALLNASPRPDTLRFRTAALRFEAAPNGHHHTLAVEVPVGDLARLQLFARLTDAAGHQVQRYVLDRAVEAGEGMTRAVLQLVWTAHIHLPPGPYRLDVAVRDPDSGRAGVTTLSFAAPAPQPGIKISSVGLIRPTAALVVNDEGVADDPFFFQGAPLMPTLGLALSQGADARVRFFVVVYPSAGHTEPVGLSLEVLRDGERVGGVPIALPPVDERGEIRYLGGMPVGSFRAGSYTLRLAARQGDAAAVEEATFVIGGETAPARVGSQQ